MNNYFAFALLFLALPLIASDKTSELQQYAEKITYALEQDDFKTAYALYTSYANHRQTTDFERAMCYSYMAECLEYMDDYQGACALRKAVLMTSDDDCITYDMRDRINKYYQNFY